jgi:hypothetical protein
MAKKLLLKQPKKLQATKSLTIKGLPLPGRPKGGEVTILS